MSYGRGWLRSIKPRDLDEGMAAIRARGRQGDPARASEGQALLYSADQVFDLIAREPTNARGADDA